MRIDISNRIGTTSNFGGFRGLLDKFSGAAAGYSLRKLSKSATNAVRVRRSSDNTEQDIGFVGTELDTTTLLDFVNARDVAPADYGAGAAAAYSLRYVSDSYTGDVVRVRRDSDNAEADFNPTEITDGTMLDWVNADVVKYTSDFTSGNEDLAESNGVATDGETIAGVSDAYKFTLTGGNTTHIAQAPTGALDANLEYNISFDYYLPSTNISDGIKLNFIAGTPVFSTTDSWTSVTLSSISPTVSGLFLRFYPSNGGSILVDADGDVFYLKNIVVAQLTSDGYVTTWYDQSGNSNDASQATAASQPKIVDAGVLVEENGKPAVDFDGVDDTLKSVNKFALASDGWFASSVINSVDVTITQHILDMDNITISERIAQLSKITASKGVSIAFTSTGTPITDFGNTISNNTQYIITSLYNGTNLEVFNNSQTDGGNALSDQKTTPTFLTLGSFNNGASNFFDGKIQELLVYPSDQSSNRGNIEANVNDYYSIYTSTNDGFVTTWYDQSGNGNDATQTSAAAQPKIVSAGVLVTENGKPALDFDGGDTSDLTNFITPSIVSTYSVAGVARPDANDDGILILSDGAENLTWHYGRTAGELSVGTYDGATVSYASGSATISNQFLGFSTHNFDTPQSTLFINGSSTSGTDVGRGDTQSRIGGGAAGRNLLGVLQEIILWASDQSSNRTGIEANINNYYNIY